jgi:hypothetical protein
MNLLKSHKTLAGLTQFWEHDARGILPPNPFPFLPLKSEWEERGLVD